MTPFYAAYALVVSLAFAVLVRATRHVSLLLCAVLVATSVGSAGMATSVAASGTNVLLGKPIVSCPAGEYGGTSCSFVNDGNESSRWIAAIDGGWWIVIDAGAPVTVKDYRVVGPTQVGALCNENGAKTIAGYDSIPTSLIDPSLVFSVKTPSLPCWSSSPTGVAYDGTLPRPFTARYFLIAGGSFYFGGWNELALYESAPLVPPTSTNVLLSQPVVACPAFGYPTDFGTGNCGDVNDGNEASRYTAQADGLWSVVIDAGAIRLVKDFRVVGPTQIGGGCNQSTAKISGFSGPPFTVNGSTMLFQYDLPNQCWSSATGVAYDGTLPQAQSARYFMISGVSFFWGGWNEFALFTGVSPNPVVNLSCPQQVFVHDGATISGGFTAPVTGQTWSATYDGFNQAGPQSLALAADHTFSLTARAPLLGPGTFHVVVRVSDLAGASGQATCTVVATPKRLALYLHGTAGDFRAALADFPKLNPALQSQVASFVPYRYYEDRGLLDASGCSPRQLPPYDPASFTFIPDPPDVSAFCDSNDDIELNGVMLDADIAALAPDFDRITIVANSGGGAIVRAYFAYALAAGTKSLDKVDQVVFLEGAQVGSYLASTYTSSGVATSDNPAVRAVRDAILAKVKETFGQDPSRPALKDLTPQSDEIFFTTRVASIPNNLHYVNVAGDMVIHIKEGNFLHEVETDTLAMGDLAIKPGSDDPTEAPVEGGARINPSRFGFARSSTQWILRHDFDVNLDSPFPLITVPIQIIGIVASPESHQFFGQKMNELCVAVPNPSGGPDRVVRLNAALLDTVTAIDATSPPDQSRLGFGNKLEVSCP